MKKTAMCSSQPKKNANTYSGETDKEGLPHGKGVKYGEDGYPLYDGEWKHGKKHGKGTEYYDTSLSKVKYEGDYVSNMKDGKGISYYYDCDDGDYEYNGEWKNDKFHGQGRYLDSNTLYIGKFIDGKREGWFKTYQWMSDIKFEKDEKKIENSRKRSSPEIDEVLYASIDERRRTIIDLKYGPGPQYTSGSEDYFDCAF